MPGTTLFVGVGSPNGDDRAGWLVADALSEIVDSEFARQRVNFMNGGGTSTVRRTRLIVRKACVPADLLDWLEGVDRLIVCDAICGCGAPGTLHYWSWPAPQIGQCRSLGSHDFGLHAVLETAGALGQLPPEVIVWGIEAGQVLPNAGLSPEIERSLPDLINRIWDP